MVSARNSNNAPPLTVRFQPLSRRVSRWTSPPMLPGGTSPWALEYRKVGPLSTARESGPSSGGIAR